MPLVLNELDNIQAAALTTPQILECEPISIVQAVKSAIRQNLSLAKEDGLVYLQTRSIKKGNGWSKVLETKRTARGEISFQRQCGRLLDIKQPVVEYNEKNQVIKVTIEYLVPSHPQPRWEVKEFDNAFFNRLRGFSHTERGRGKQDADNQKMNYANHLYTSFNGWIDPEFAKAKAIRHALKNLGGNIAELKAQHIQIEAEVLSTEAAMQEVTEDAEVIEEVNINNFNL